MIEKSLISKPINLKVPKHCIGMVLFILISSILAILTLPYSSLLYTKSQ